MLSLAHFRTFVFVVLLRRDLEKTKWTGWVMFENDGNRDFFKLLTKHEAKKPKRKRN